MRGFLACLCAAGMIAGSSAAETVHELKIGTFADGILSSTAAKSTVDAMNGLVANSGHAECAGVGFKIVLGPQKYGPNIPKSVGNGNFQQFRGSGFSINLVSQVQECGGFVVARGQSFAGCTDKGSFPVTVIASSRRDMRPFLWLHELGHSQGLADRCDDREDGCRSNIGWVMAGVLDKRNVKIGSDECRALDGEQNFPILIEADNALENSVDDILEQDWNHAMPVLSILDLTDADKERLRAALMSDDTSLWANAVLALGLVGTEDDVETITGILDAPILSTDPEAEAGEVDFGVIDAKLNVPIALGYIANRTQSGAVIGRLEELVAPTRNASLFEGFADPDATAEYSAALARNVAVGLALSGITEGSSANLQTRAIFDSNFRGSNRESSLNMDEAFVEQLDGLSVEVSRRGLAEVLLEQTTEFPQ